MAKQHHPPGNGKSGQVITSATHTSGYSGNGDVASITVVGDGVNDVIVEWSVPDIQSSGVAATDVRTRIWDGASGTGTQYAEVAIDSTGAGYKHNGNGFCRVSAWSGSRTFYLHLSASAGTPSSTTSSTAPATLIARWA